MLIGALIFGYFLTITQTPQKVTEFLTGLGLGRYGVLALIMLMYLVLGCLMDAMAMIILTVPIIFPVITHLGFNPIWFGVIIVMTVELGLIHPPVGMNVFVIKSVVKDVSFATIFKGVIPFILTDLIRLVDPDRLPDHRAVAALAYVRRSCANIVWVPTICHGRDDGTLVQEGSAGAASSATARPSTAKASSPSPRRCCSPACPMSAATRARRSRICSTCWSTPRT